MKLRTLSFLAKKGHHSSSTQNHPQRDWFILIMATLVGFLLIAAWNLIAFQLQVNGTPGAEPGAGGVTIKTGSVESVQTFFDKRAEMRGEYLSTKRFVDPSR